MADRLWVVEVRYPSWQPATCEPGETRAFTNRRAAQRVARRIEIPTSRVAEYRRVEPKPDKPKARRKRG